MCIYNALLKLTVTKLFYLSLMFALDNVETAKSSHVLEERGTLFVSLSLHVYPRMFTTYGSSIWMCCLTVYIVYCFDCNLNI